MKILISEEQKKKLFIPRRQSGENSRWNQWNKEQPIKTIDGEEIRINQYDENGLKQGYWDIYYGNDNIYFNSIGKYKNGKKYGVWEFYWDNGNIKYRGLFKDDKRDGMWEEYFSNGKLFRKALYKDGNRDGLWEYIK